MDRILTCPSQIELIHLNNGDFTKARSELLFNHIETCEPCSVFYGELKDPPDNFFSYLNRMTREDMEKAQKAIERHRIRQKR